MKINSNFDGGNIKVIEDQNPENIKLEINKDAHSDFFQWFYFRCSGGANKACTITIKNAADAAYTGGWEDYKACASYDRENWFRVDTDYKDGKLIIRHTPEFNSVYYAYFAPYSMERHADLIADCTLSPLVTPHVLGETLDGQDMDLLEVKDGQGGDKYNCWFIARQHPGETMAEWWMEGLLGRLLDGSDPVARSLLKKCNFFIVPNMNPDGSRRGHLRTNASGANLNREWANPTLEKSPEVFFVKRAMVEYGVDFHMDVHGDEALPYNFIAGFEAINNATPHQLKLLDVFQMHYQNISPDFQREHGYGKGVPGTTDMKKCTENVAETFGCLAMTLEMPFKDNADLTDETFGWSPERSQNLGRSALDALWAIVDDLRE